MANQTQAAEVNIHLRARGQDRDIIDRAAALVGANRSQFMLASAVKEAKSVLLDQTSFYADGASFAQTMAWLDGPAGATESEGLRRLAKAKLPWSDE